MHGQIRFDRATKEATQHSREENPKEGKTVIVDS